MHCSQSLCPAVCMVPFHRKTADNLRLRSNRLCARSHSRNGVCRLWKQSPTWAWLTSHRPMIDSDYMRAADWQSRVTGCRVSVGGSSIHLTPRVSSVDVIPATGVDCANETSVGPARLDWEVNCLSAGALYRCRGTTTSKATFYDSGRRGEYTSDYVVLREPALTVIRKKTAAGRGDDYWPSAAGQFGGVDCANCLCLRCLTNDQSTWTHEATPCTRTGYR